MEFILSPRFERDLRSYGSEMERRFLDKLSLLEQAIANPKLHTGLGLRKLKTRKWDFREIRLDLSVRAVFRLGGDEALFVLVGSHDDVRRFIKHL